MSLEQVSHVNSLWLLARLNAIFEETGVHAILDGGTLLRLHRDGDLSPRPPDMDMDFAVLGATERQKVAVSRHVKGLGFSCLSRSLAGSTQKLYARPRRLPIQNTIDIHYYSESDGGWRTFSAAGQRQSANRSKISGAVVLPTAPLRALQAVRWALGRLAARIDLQTLYRLPRIQGYVLTVPQQLFSNVKPIHLDSGLVFNSVLVPRDVNSYLEFAYGDWKTPQTDWNSLASDGRIGFL